MALFGHTEAEFKAKCGENGVGGHIHIPARSDPKHSADVNRRWAIWNVPHQLHTPAQSPDIEYLWRILKKGVYKREVSSKEELKRLIVEKWEKIKPETRQSLVNLMRTGLNALIKENGYAPS